MGTAYLFLLSALCGCVNGLKINPSIPQLKVEETDHSQVTDKVMLEWQVAKNKFELMTEGFTGRGIYYDTNGDGHGDVLELVGPGQGKWSPGVDGKDIAWMAMHKTIVKEAQAYTPSKPGEHKLAMFGDSLIEECRGTNFGTTSPRLKEKQNIFQRTLGSQYPDPHVSAIWADEYPQLWYRIKNGALSEAMMADEGLMMSLLISAKAFSKPGSADLDTEINTISAGVINITRFMLQKTKGKLLLNSQMMAGSRVYNTKVSDVINAKNAAAVEALQQEFPGRVAHGDCTGPFKAKLDAIKPAKRTAWDTTPLMEGAEGSLYGTHPNKKGHKIWMECILSHLKKLESL